MKSSLIKEKPLRKSHFSTINTLSLSSSLVEKEQLDKKERENFEKNNSSLCDSSNKEQVKTIIVNDKETNDNYNNFENLNQTSTFIPITYSNKISNKSGSFNEIQKLSTDKFTFKNINNSICDFDISKETISNYDNFHNSIYSGSLMNSPCNYNQNYILNVYKSNNNTNNNYLTFPKSIFSKNSLSPKNNFSDFSCKIIREEIKNENEEEYISNKINQSSEVLSTNSDDNGLLINKKNQSDLKNNLNKIIPVYSIKLHLKKFKEYIETNIPSIYAKNTDNKVIKGFSAFTYKNESSNIKTKISININLSNEHGTFNFFSLHNPLITDEYLDLKYNELCENKLMLNQTFLQDSNGDIIILKFQSSTFSAFNNINPLLNKHFSYKIILSTDNAQNIYNFNINQKIRIQKNFDFMILCNKGIFKYLSNKEICTITYITMKNTILLQETFSYFLDNIIKNIFKNVIKNGGEKDMAIIFICFRNLQKIFEKKNLEKIREALVIIENTTFNDEEEESNFINNSHSSCKSYLSPKIIVNNQNNINLSFQDKYQMSNETDFVNKNKEKVRKKSFLKCCGFFC